MQGSTLIKAVAAVAVLVFISALALTVYKSGGAALNWQMGGSDPVIRFYPSSAGIYVVGSANVSLVDGAGKAIWSVPFPGTEYSAYGDDTLYVYSADRGLNAIRGDGSIRTLTKQGMNFPPIVGPDGTLYLRSWSLLSALDSSGNEKWNISSVVSDPVVDGQGNIYFFTRPPEHISDVYLESIAPDGSQRWSILYQKYYASTRLMPARTEGIFVYDEPTGILDHLSSGGNVTWDHTMPYLGQYSLIEDDRSQLYLFYVFGTVHVVNERGTLIGKFNPVITNNANLSYRPAVYNDTVYVIGDAGKDVGTLYALGLDGSLKWKRSFNSSATPVIYTGRDVVCVDTESRGVPVLYVIDDKGELKFTYNSGDGSRWEQVYVDENDTVYAKTYGGMLYALKG